MLYLNYTGKWHRGIVNVCVNKNWQNKKLSRYNCLLLIFMENGYYTLSEYKKTSSKVSLERSNRQMGTFCYIFNRSIQLRCGTLTNQLPFSHDMRSCATSWYYYPYGREFRVVSKYVRRFIKFIFIRFYSRRPTHVIPHINFLVWLDVLISLSTKLFGTDLPIKKYFFWFHILKRVHL